MFDFGTVVTPQLVWYYYVDGGWTPVKYPFGHEKRRDYCGPDPLVITLLPEEYYMELGELVKRYPHPKMPQL